MSTRRNTSLLSARHRRAIAISVMAAAALYLAAVIATGYEQAWHAFFHLGWHGWLLLLACSFSSYLIRYVRWQYYLRRAGWHIPHRLHFLYYLAGFALTTTPGKAGETIRSVLLRPHGVPYHTSLASFVCERLLDVMVIAMLASLLLTLFTEHALFVVLAGASLLAILPLLHSPYPARMMTWLQTLTRSQRIQRGLQHMLHLLGDARMFLAPRMLYAGFALGALAWTIQGLAFYYVLQQAGMQITLVLALGIYALSLLAGAASMIPGGLGSTELAMGLLLGAAGADQALVLTVPVISRLATLWFAVLLGFIATGILGSHRKSHTTI